ncbi:MAG: hypothetical protein FWG87_14875 [Defluviitaleaceae bacterium]|nr:hypothetical protein [Defluviitaleaceae bacterium]
MRIYADLCGFMRIYADLCGFMRIYADLKSAFHKSVVKSLGACRLL